MPHQPMPVSVLIIDDDAMVRELLAVLLQAEGHAVECADSGDAALALLNRGGRPPNVVLTDLQMPGTTGDRLARALRRACGPATLLLAMSGSGPPGDAISLFDGFLMKPFTTQQFAAALAAHRQQHATERPAMQNRRRTVPRFALPSRYSLRLESLSASAPSASAPSTSAPPTQAPRPASKKRMASPVQEPQTAQPIAHDNRAGNLADSPVLDQKIYQQLADSMPAQQLQEMYAMCLNDARKRIALMRSLAAAGDGPQFVREAHAVKGSSGMLGATQLYTIAALLEKRGPQPPDTAAAPRRSQGVNSLDELADACDRLERILGSRA